LIETTLPRNRPKLGSMHFHKRAEYTVFRVSLKNDFHCTGDVHSYTVYDASAVYALTLCLSVCPSVCHKWLSRSTMRSV